jgi:ABC-type dipeptide/oligopeptide/nickel transport system permease component
MHRFVINRLLWAIPVLLLVSIVTFGAMQLVPGGPFTAGSDGRAVPPEIQNNMEAKYGLDKPAWQQYLNYMERLIFHFDFGPSLRQPGRSVNSMLFGENQMARVVRERLQRDLGNEARSIHFLEPPGLFSREVILVKKGEVIGKVEIYGAERLEAWRRTVTTAPVMVSAQIGVVSLFIAIAIGIPLGVISALRQNTMTDYSAMFVSMLGVSIPNFVLGIMLIFVFAIWLEWLPVYGWGDSWKQVIMPAITLGTAGTALIARLTRAAMLETVRQDYIRTARAKGLRERLVIVRHGLRNSLIPVVTVLGPLTAAWLTGSFLVEWIFSIPGIGKFFVTSVTNRDYMLIMGTILIYAGALVIFNLLVDITYGFLDPRIRYD